MLISGIIPARYGSTRFPGKPLAMLDGKTIIKRVYEQASLVLDNVYVASDDIRIAEEVKSFGGNIIMTSDTHRSGTDRCAEALRLIRESGSDNPDVIINIQGDEPFIKPEQISQLINLFSKKDVEIATLVKLIDSDKELHDVNKPKVVVAENGYALYFSRSIVPYIRDAEPGKWLETQDFYKHIGIYGYRADTLLSICNLQPSPLEISESLEQLRWLENGYKIRTAITSYESIGIDTPEDLENAKVLLKKQ
ncbi:MAG: 3-deoxy-manno-octulosonate cytidylyltransferase [Bacteroidales bacterium]|nr:3-deoxy-manno-octulosonate cytidylyltransferase [Bacteroidales bacterium]